MRKKSDEQYLITRYCRWPFRSRRGGGLDRATPIAPLLTSTTNLDTLHSRYISSCLEYRQSRSTTNHINKTSGQLSLVSLPDELLIKIMKDLSWSDVFNLNGTCRKLRKLTLPVIESYIRDLEKINREFFKDLRSVNTHTDRGSEGTLISSDYDYDRDRPWSMRPMCDVTPRLIDDSLTATNRIVNDNDVDVDFHEYTKQLKECYLKNYL